MDKIFSDHLLAILPPGARAKAMALEDRYVLAMLSRKSVYDKEYAEQEGIARRRWNLKTHRERLRAARHQTEDVIAEIAQVETKLAACEVEWETNKRRTEATQGAVHGVEVVTEVVQWLRDARRSHFTGQAGHAHVLFHDAPHKGKITGDPRVAIDKARLELAEIDAEWRRLEVAPATAKELVAGALDAVSAIAERGHPSLNSRARSGDPFNLSKIFDGFGLDNGGAIKGVGPHFFVWLLQDMIEVRLIEEIGSDAPGAITYDARERRFADLAARKLDLERREEAAIVAAEAVGQPIKRRRDADPRAVLEIAEIG